MKVVSTWPSMKAEWLKISRCSGMVVLIPSTTNSARARRMHGQGFGAGRLVDQQLGDQGIVIGTAPDSRPRRGNRAGRPGRPAAASG